MIHRIFAVVRTKQLYQVDFYNPPNKTVALKCKLQIILFGLKHRIPYANVGAGFARPAQLTGNRQQHSYPCGQGDTNAIFAGNAPLACGYGYSAFSRLFCVT
jgi:hypothetical protein